MLGKKDELGAISAGYLADLVAVDGDPLAGTSIAIIKVKLVMKSGAVVVDQTNLQK